MIPLHMELLNISHFRQVNAYDYFHPYTVPTIQVRIGLKCPRCMQEREVLKSAYFAGWYASGKGFKCDICERVMRRVY